MKNADLHCSFCGKSQDAVGKLISSPKERPGTFICDECVTVCAKILEDDRPAANKMDPHPPSMMPRWVARMLDSYKS